ncbi:MAG: ATP-binding protein, partial [Prevotella sp.]
PGQAEYSLSEIFAYMEQSDYRCFVAFDEFQTIAGYADKNVEALLRSYIQRLTNVNFIFSGSQRHVLENMFVSASRPFYQSTQMMPLGTIDENAYYMFSSEKMRKIGQSIDRDTFDYIYTKLSSHTWYVHTLLNRLYETGLETINKYIVDEILSDILLENEGTFQTFLRLVTPIQTRVLYAIASEGSIKEIQGKAFLTKYQLGAASTVKTSVKSLVEKELLIDNNGEYQLYDRFFGLWLVENVR